MNQIQYLNVVWILSSFALLYYGVTGNGENMYTAFLFIVLIFLVIWYVGTREKAKQSKITIFGNKVTGQWGK